MTRKKYEIEFIVWECARTRLDSPRLKSFTTQKAAREWLESMGFEPVFKGKRPSIYRSRRDRYGRSGMQATIIEAGRAGWIESSTEGRAALRVARACR